MNPGSSDLRVRALNQGSLETAAAIIAGWRDGGEARPWGEPGPGLEMTNWREEATAEGAVSTARPGAVGEACMLGAFICSTCPHAGPGWALETLASGCPQCGGEQNKELGTGRECCRGQQREGVCPPK